MVISLSGITGAIKQRHLLVERFATRSIISIIGIIKNNIGMTVARTEGDIK